jgi:dihydroflavonol-4-reductase
MWLARAAAPFAELVARIARSEPLFTSESLGALRANRDIRCDKAVRELGYAPRPFARSVADIYDWFKATGRL